jgi:OPT family oligopeptide transporter
MLRLNRESVDSESLRSLIDVTDNDDRHMDDASDSDGVLLFGKVDGDDNVQAKRPTDIEVPAAVKKKRQFTLRAVLVGLFVGALLCTSNMYFGLQTGWVTMASVQAAILGFLIFKGLHRFGWVAEPLSPYENVVLQTVSVASATMPLAGGFVGIIPALTMMTPTPVTLSWWQQILWAFALAFFGVFVAVPLRRQTVLKERLRFPSGTATAKMIAMFHTPPPPQDDDDDEDEQQQLQINDEEEEEEEEEAEDIPPIEVRKKDDDSDCVWSENQGHISEQEWRLKWILLCVGFCASSAYTLLTYFFPILYKLPVFTWIGLPSVTSFGWVLTPSFSYVGQGMLMGFRVGMSMLLGAVIGWGVLGPMSQGLGWTSDSVMSLDDGASGWLLWISLCIMLAETMTSLVILIVRNLYARWQRAQRRRERQQRRQRRRAAHDSANESDDDDDALLENESGDDDDDFVEAIVVDPAPLEERVPKLWWMCGLAVSSIVCWIIVAPMFDMAIYEPPIALIFSMLTAVLAVRALGETDLNPVSGIGKLSQILFAAIAPGDVTANLIAGAVAEAGAQQSGDLMQDLKTGHLLRASPRAQFFGQLIGSFFSVFVTVGAYALYTMAWPVPSDQFPVPTAGVWLDMAQLVNGGTIADHVGPFCIGATLLAASVPIVNTFYPRFVPFSPSGIAIGVAFYTTPNWSVARAIGSAIQFFWLRYARTSHDRFMIILASAFVLGEGLTSIVTALFKTLGVPQY